MHNLYIPACIVEISDEEYKWLSKLGDKAGKVPDVYAQEKFNQMAKTDLCIHLLAYRQSEECAGRGLDVLHL